MPDNGQLNHFKEVSDMRSDVITLPMPESFPNNDGDGVRLLAYAYAISGKDRSAVSSNNGTAKGGSGITGLKTELEKTRLDA